MPQEKGNLEEIKEILKRIKKLMDTVRNKLENENFEEAEKAHKEVISCHQELVRLCKERGEEEKSKYFSAHSKELDASFLELYWSKKNSSKIPDLEDKIREKYLNAGREYEEIGESEDAKDCYENLAEYYGKIGAIEKEYKYTIQASNTIENKIAKDEEEIKRLKAESEFSKGIGSLRYSLFLRLKFKLKEALNLIEEAKESFNKAKILYEEIEDGEEIEKCETLRDISLASIHVISGIMVASINLDKAEEELNTAKSILNQVSESPNPEIYRTIEAEIFSTDSAISWFRAMESVRKKDLESANKLYKESLTSFGRAKNMVINQQQKVLLRFEEKTRQLLYAFFQGMASFELNEFDHSTKKLNEALTFVAELNDFYNSIPLEFKGLLDASKSFFFGHTPFSNGLIKHIEGIKKSFYKKEEALELLDEAIKKYEEALDIFVGNIDINPLLRDMAYSSCQLLKRRAGNYLKLLTDAGIYCPWIDKECKEVFKTKDQCFIIYDYEIEESDRFEETVLEIVNRKGLEPKIAKYVEKPQSTAVFCTRICKEIRQSKLCIADISKENTSVGLEISIAWRFNVPILLTIRESDVNKAPFDLSAFHFSVIYKDIYDLREKLPKEIENAMKFRM